MRNCKLTVLGTGLIATTATTVPLLSPPPVFPATGRLRAGLITLAAGVGLLLATAASARADVIYQYQFSPDASITTTLGVSTISGTFSYDVNSDTYTSVAGITLSGAFAHTYTAFENTSPNTVELDDPSYSNPIVVINLVDPLSVDSSDDLALSYAEYTAVWVQNVEGEDNCTQGCTIDEASAVSGSVDPAPAPEPSSLALLGGALAGLGFVRRRKRAA